MPDCGSQIILCDVPIRLDTYKGCAHGCKYCFTYRKYDISKIKNNDSPSSLKDFINGKRNSTCFWCDWNIPLHWGGLSDPFQPIEKEKKRSLEMLKIFAETQYPTIVSTKGRLVVEPEYLDLIKKCNMVVQISMVSPKYDKLEQNAPPFEERLSWLKTLSKNSKRLIVRCQPYMLEAREDVLNILPEYKKRGVHGIIFEGIKFFSKIHSDLIKLGADYAYPYKIIKSHFEQIKDEAHKHGLKIYAGENRLRPLGDSLSCCGYDGLEGFKGNTANLNHYLYDKPNFKYTPQMEVNRTSHPLGASAQTSIRGKVLGKETYKNMFELILKDKKKLNIYLSRD
jgi:DNA repair photolyase